MSAVRSFVEHPSESQKYPLSLAQAHLRWLPFLKMSSLLILQNSSALLGQSILFSGSGIGKQIFPVPANNKLAKHVYHPFRLSYSPYAKVWHLV